jgi:hypothetical protein
VGVDNVAPILGITEAYVEVDFALRIAGEKFHDVRLSL